MRPKNLFASLVLASIIGPRCDIGYAAPTADADTSPTETNDLAGEQHRLAKQGNDPVVR